MSKATHNFDSRAIVDAIVAGIDLATQQMVRDVQNDIKSSISGEGTGVRYPGSLRRSSRPGEPPAKQEGNLSRSWQVGKPSRIRQGRRVGWRVGSNQPYASLLEFGGGRIAARPYVRPALARIAPRAEEIVGKFVRDQIRRLRMRPQRT